jgi:chromosome segregation ATPase
VSDALLGKFVVKAVTNKALVACLSQDLAMQQSKFAQRLKALESENAKLKQSTYEMQQENQRLQTEIHALQARTFDYDPEWTNLKLTIQREISRELWSESAANELELDRLRKMDVLRKLQEEEKRQLENKCRDMDCRLRAAESSLEELRQEIADLDVVELYRAWSPNDDLKEQHRKLEQKYSDLQTKMRMQDRVLQGKELKLEDLEEKQSFAVLSNWLDPNPKHDLVGALASPNFQQSRFFSDDWCMHMHRRLRNRREVCIPQPQWRPGFHLFPSLGRLLQRLPVK